MEINCDDCVMQRTSACDDCVVSFIVGREPGEAIVIDVEEERAVSASRRRVHDRIALYPDQAGDDLVRRERELSERRRELHAEIDELRQKREPGT